MLVAAQNGFLTAAFLLGLTFMRRRPVLRLGVRLLDVKPQLGVIDPGAARVRPQLARLLWSAVFTAFSSGVGASFGSRAGAPTYGYSGLPAFRHDGLVRHFLRMMPTVFAVFGRWGFHRRRRTGTVAGDLGAARWSSGSFTASTTSAACVRGDLRHVPDYPVRFQLRHGCAMCLRGAAGSGRSRARSRQSRRSSDCAGRRHRRGRDELRPYPFALRAAGARRWAWQPYAAVAARSEVRAKCQRPSR